MRRGPKDAEQRAAAAAWERFGTRYAGTAEVEGRPARAGGPCRGRRIASVELRGTRVGAAMSRGMKT